MKKLFSLLILSCSFLSASILISAGGFDVKQVGQSYYFKDSVHKGKHINITKVLAKKSNNTNAVTMWITRGWQEDWYDIATVQKQIINKGYTPVFIFYWFADEINPDYVKRNKKAYFQALQRFTSYMKKLSGKKIVILNPEYNMFRTEKWDGMNDIFLKSFDIVRQDKNALVGPCIGDFGNYAKVNEPREWRLFDRSIRRAAKRADFIAFQEMRALTRNSEGDIIRTAQRAYNFSKYLHKKYKKPTMLAYTAISSYGEDGEHIQAQAYKSFVKYLPRMRREANLMLFGTFHYFDYPGHEGYFNEAEEHFGLLRKDGIEKPSCQYFNKLY